MPSAWPRQMVLPRSALKNELLPVDGRDLQRIRRIRMRAADEPWQRTALRTALAAAAVEKPMFVADRAHRCQAPCQGKVAC